MEYREQSEFKTRRLRWIRILIAGVSLVAMTALFVLPLRRVVSCFGWLPEIQLVSAIATGAVMTLVVLLVLTIVFGRVYCSVVCPLGVAQDLFRYVLTLGFLRRKQSLRACWLSDRGLWIVRSVFLICFAVLVLYGLTALLEPYGIFGRTATLAREFLGWILQGHGILGRIASRLHIKSEMMLPASVSVMIVLSAVIIFGASLFRARWWCNTVCPIGTLLGIVSRWSVFRARIDPEKCVGCGLCAKSCEKGAIVFGSPARVDNSRCVVCLKCAGACKKGALKWH